MGKSLFQKDEHMRNGKALLLAAVIALAGVACLMLPEANRAVAVGLEESDAEMPNATVLFPVSEKPNPKGASMTPVTFNHQAHVDKIDDCAACHHTGDMVACSTCHTVEGKAEGNFINLERAMHATKIAPRKDGVTPKSCVSCHEEQYKERRECAGCHEIVTPKRDDKWCGVCHVVTSKMTPEQYQLGVAGKLSAEDRVALAEATIAERKPMDYLAPEACPYKVEIGSLSDKFEPNLFNHRRHVSSLMKRIEGDNLAKAFHSEPEILCATCHHRSPLSATPPKCGSCHSAKIDPRVPERPTLKAAYHLQCMGCHDGMDVARPLDTSCASCHKPRATENAN